MIGSKTETIAMLAPVIAIGMIAAAIGYHGASHEHDLPEPHLR
jgi:hypothetical protein